ncbi:MAG: tetratricopeptide repeat protein, partial [Parafilimonas sp.]
MEAVKGIYHPDKLDAETFIKNFTIRLKEFKSIIDNLKKQKKKPLQHFLITGKRGMGKSTLLRRLYLEAKQKPLSDKLIAVRLGSEQYKLSRLYKLWEEVINILSIEDEALNEKRRKITDEKNYEDLLIHIIIDYLNKQDKTLLLLIDNFDKFVDKLNSKEQHVFREILIQYPIQIIGNTIFYGEHFFKYDKAFFDFFKPVHLRNLDKDEAEEFIKQLAANEEIENFDDILKNQKGKIETLRILSGGVPRTLVILLSILSKRNTGDAIDYLNEMLEQVTPLYQDRMKALSSQQQEIMHHLAIFWDRTSAKELAAETRIPSKSISAQLAQLEDSGYINKISTSKRNHLYEIDERFFNIWILMSESSAYDVKRVIWLTRWLDVFYESNELEEYASYCNNGLRKTKPANRFLIMQALSESKKLGWKLRDQLVRETAEELSVSIPEIKEWVKSYSKHRSQEITDLDKEIKEAIENKQYENALTKLKEFENVDEAKSNFGIGLVYNLQKDYDKAEQFYLMAVEKGDAKAMFNLGLLYQNVKKDYDKAEQYYLMAIEKGDAKAMFNLGFFYKDVRKDYDKAEQYYLMAVEKGDEQAMFNLGFLYQDVKKDYDKAEQYYLMAVEKG